MNLTPWHKNVTPRPEVREGRSFNPDEFAIALEQVVAGTAPLDYRDAEQKRGLDFLWLGNAFEPCIRRIQKKSDYSMLCYLQWRGNK